MEALKHNFFLKGFFKHRGYFDSSELTEHAVAKMPARQPMKQFVFDGKDLFNKPDMAKLSKEKTLNQVGSYLESNPYGMVTIVVNTSTKGEKEENMKLSEARAMVVRQYLAKKFKVDDSRIKTMGTGEKGQAGTDDNGRLAIVIYPGDSGQKLRKARINNG